MARLLDRETRRDFHPRIQVVIEVERPTITVATDGTITREGGRLLVLDQETLTDVASNMSLTRPPDATFGLANPRDKWFNSARKLDQMTRRQKETSEYLLEVLEVSTVAERNSYRRQRFWELFKEGKITLGALRQATKFGIQKLNGAFAPGQPPGDRLDAYALYEYFSPELDLMNRVWINYGDRNNTPDSPSLVAGFTGYISAVTKARQTGQHGTVNVTCRGLLSLMQRSEIVLSLALDQRNEPLSGEDIKKADFAATTNSLAGLNGIQIIERALERTQDSFVYNAGDVASKEADDYFHQDKLWQLEGDPYPSPDGAPAVNVGYGPDSVAVNPARSYVDGETTAASLNGKFIVDPKLVEDDAGQFQVFEKMIRSSFQLYQNTTQVALSLCREVADCIGYDFFEDPKGNVVFQLPKYDLLPRVRGSTGYDPRDYQLGRIRFGDDYSDLPFHDRDYILDSIGNLGIRENLSEEALVNFVIATSVPNWVRLDDGTLKMLSLLGSTSPAFLDQELGRPTVDANGIERKISEEAERVRRLTRRFGVRRHMLRSMVTGIGATNFLTRYAYQHLVRINAGIHTATINLNMRPDIWPGRTVFLVEEQKIGYVVGASNSFNRSARSNHSTSLTLAYLHHPNERIGIPWLVATDTAAAKAQVVPENVLYQDTEEALNALTAGLQGLG